MGQKSKLGTRYFGFLNELRVDHRSTLLVRPEYFGSLSKLLRLTR